MATASSLHIVSVSLGSSVRDKKVLASFAGREVCIERRGTDGDLQRAIELITELDGHVDAIGLGGIDLYLIAAGKKFVIREALKMARAAQTTPVVDGSGLKHTLERRTVQWLQETGTVDFRDKKVLLVSGVDRFGMAEALPALGAKTGYGDMIFALGIPYLVKSLATLKLLAWSLLPIITKLPFSMIYPTGDQQKKISNKHGKFFDWADIIAGDFLFIRRYMPERLDGKIIITNTTTEADLALLRERGASMLISTTPQFDGRSFGTNVMEGVIVALNGKRPEDMTPEDYITTLENLGWTPNVVRF
ncbi:MAG TPA: quinate 5-dehydrogenase [Armatimonadota bacterium]|nr:quinate 5-dehydrogenase [Armatimonadota bacterium]